VDQSEGKGASTSAEFVGFANSRCRDAEQLAIAQPQTNFLGGILFRHDRSLVAGMHAPRRTLSRGALAQVIIEFTTGVNAGAQPLCFTAGPDGNLWFTEPIR